MYNGVPSAVDDRLLRRPPHSVHCPAGGFSRWPGKTRCVLAGWTYHISSCQAAPWKHPTPPPLSVGWLAGWLVGTNMYVQRHPVRYFRTAERFPPRLERANARRLFLNAMAKLAAMSHAHTCRRQLVGARDFPQPDVRQRRHVR